MSNIMPLMVDWEIPPQLITKYSPDLPAFLFVNGLLRISVFGSSGGQYTKIENSYGESGFRFNGSQYNPQNQMRGWSILIDYNLYPLRLLFEELYSIQRSTKYSEYQLTKIYDYAGFDFQDYSAKMSVRYVELRPLQDAGEGSGAVQAGHLECVHQDGVASAQRHPDVPNIFYCAPFRVVYYETRGNY